MTHAARRPNRGIESDVGITTANGKGESAGRCQRQESGMNAHAGIAHITPGPMGTVHALADHPGHGFHLSPIDKIQESLDTARKTIDFTGHG